MVEIVSQTHHRQKPGTGRPSKLTVEDQVLRSLEYSREYRTYFHIAQSWGINESTADRIIRKVEDYSIASEVFSLPEKKTTRSRSRLFGSGSGCNRKPNRTSPKKQQTYYSGKKKRYTLKSEIFIDQSNKQIICTAYAKGKKHNFTLFKSSKTRLLPEIKCLADKGYQGIAKIHANSRTPDKKPRGSKLSVEDKHSNQQLANLRVVIEHINR